MPLTGDYDSKRIQLPADHQAIAELLVQVLTQEVSALQGLIEQFPLNASRLVDIIVKTTGKIIFTGLGKSGLVGRKLAATFSSVGSPALFLHPSDALHGDLGVVQPHDTLIILSKSGSGSELEVIAQSCSQLLITTVLLCCKSGPVAPLVDVTIQLSCTQEACFLGLAPSSSSTLMMAFGDALALVVSKLKNFKADDFAKNHPAGMLGKKLLLTVASIMHKGTSLPLLSSSTSFQETIVSITQKKRGLGIVVDDNKQLLGIITDGDLRRACSTYGKNLFDQEANQLMTRNPKTITPEMKAVDALALMEELAITSLVVIYDGVVVGLVHMHDLVKIGLLPNEKTK